MENCIFCKIVKGEIPSEKIYENEKFLAFLDLFPSTEGHTLIVPKKHYENIFDIPQDILKDSIEVAQKIASLLKEKLGAEGINLLNSNNKIAQQEIPHYHLHVIPRYSKDNFEIVFKDKTKNKNLKETAKKILK
jgi:histidine triad (HIT) family protein